MIADALEAFLAHVAGRLHAAAIKVPERRFVSPGAPPHDSCDSDALVVWWESIASTTIPNLPDGSGPARYAFSGTSAVRFTVELSRCRAGDLMLDGRYAPAPEVVARVARTVADDGWVVHHALRETTPAVLGLEGCSVSQSDGVVPIPVSGGQVGVTGSIVVQIDALLPWSS